MEPGVNKSGYKLDINTNLKSHLYNIVNFKPGKCCDAGVNIWFQQCFSETKPYAVLFS